MYDSVGLPQKMFQNSCFDELPGPGPVSLLVRLHMVFQLSEAAVPVPRDDVQLVRVQGVWGEDLLEEVKPRIGLSLCRCVDRGNSEVLASNFEI